jgi:hypothetical protein
MIHQNSALIKAASMIEQRLSSGKRFTRSLPLRVRSQGLRVQGIGGESKASLKSGESSEVNG